MVNDIGFNMFGAMEEIIAQELEVDSKTYSNILENYCTYNEGKFIVFSLLSNREDKKQKAIKLFKSKLNEKSN
jgi:hypothetical protein